MKAVVISDIHIHGGEDPLYVSLLKLMRDELAPGDQLVLAGDIFDFLVGPSPAAYRRYPEFFAAVGELGAKGVPITYIEGNHDFHLSGLFSNYPHVEVVAAEKTFRMGNRTLVVAHGDLVDQRDRGYLFLRRVFRSRYVRFASARLPQSWVDWIGKRASEASRAKTPRLPEDRGVEARDRLREIYRNFARAKFDQGVDAIVLGHCHDLDGQEFEKEGRVGRYLNVGYPRAHRAYVVFIDGRLERRALA